MFIDKISFILLLNIKIYNIFCKITVGEDCTDEW